MFLNRRLTPQSQIKATSKPVYQATRGVIRALMLLSILTAVSIVAALTQALARTPPLMDIRSKTPDAGAFTNARIVVSPQLTYDNGALIIQDGKVLDVGDRAAVPPDIITIDLPGEDYLPRLYRPVHRLQCGEEGKAQETVQQMTQTAKTSV